MQLQPHEHSLFPSKLWRLLDDAEKDGYSGVISWVDAGTAFQIHDRERVIPILKKRFHVSKWKSFLRQLQAYKFRRESPSERNGLGEVVATSKPSNKGRWRHELFRSDKVDWCLKIKREETNKGRKTTTLAAAKAKAAALAGASSPTLPSTTTTTTLATPVVLAWSQLASKVLQHQQQQQEQQQQQLPTIALGGVSYNDATSGDNDEAFEEQLAMIERRKRVLLAQRRLQQERKQNQHQQRERELELEQAAARSRVLLAHQRVLKEARLCQRRDLELKKMNLEMIARRNGEILERHRADSELIRALKLKLRRQHSSDAIAAAAARKSGSSAAAALSSKQRRWKEHMRRSEKIVANALDVVSSEVGLASAAATKVHPSEQPERALVSRSPSPAASCDRDNRFTSAAQESSDESERVSRSPSPSCDTQSLATGVKRSTPPRKRWLASKRLSLLKRTADTSSSSSPSSEERPSILEQFAETAMLVGLARAA